jgi:signal transduction histidine kinase
MGAESDPRVGPSEKTLDDTARIVLVKGVFAAFLIILLLNLVKSILGFFGSGSVYPRALNVSGLIVYSACLAGTAAMILASHPRFFSVRFAELSGLIFMALHLALLPTDMSGSPYPPLLSVMGAGMCLVLVTRRLGLGVVVLILYGVGYTMIRTRMLGWEQGLVSGLTTLTGTVGASLLSRLALVAIVDREESIRRAIPLLALEAATSEASRERDRLDALVHDSVIGALHLGSLSDFREAARATARQAIRSFRGLSEAPADLLAGVEERASHLGLRLTLDVASEDPPPEDVRAAMTLAALEALTNVSRHAGVSDVCVTGSLGRESARLVIADEGRGFGTTAPGHHGIEGSIVRRLQSVGGRGTVVSSPGRGTRVELVWDAYAPAAAARRVSLSHYAPLAAVAFTNCFLLMVTLVQSRPQVSGLLWASMVLIFVGTVTSTLVPWSSRLLRYLPGVLALLGGVLAVVGCSPKEGQAADFWFVGALSPFIAITAFRFSGRLAFASITVLGCVTTAVMVRCGFDILPSLTDYVPGMIAGAIGSFMVRRSIQASRAAAAESADSALRAETNVAKSRARREQLRERNEALGESCFSMLERLASPAALNDDDRAECRRLARTVRDHLNAPTIVTRPVMEALRRARANDVDISLSASGEDAGPRGTAFSSLLVLCLVHLTDLTRLRAFWDTERDSRGQGTLLLEGPRSAEARDVMARAAAEDPAVADLLRLAETSVVDDDTLLLEFSPLNPGETPGGDNGSGRGVAAAVRTMPTRGPHGRGPVPE